MSTGGHGMCRFAGNSFAGNSFHFSCLDFFSLFLFFCLHVFHYFACFFFLIFFFRKIENFSHHTTPNHRTTEPPNTQPNPTPQASVPLASSSCQGNQKTPKRDTLPPCLWIMGSSEKDRKACIMIIIIVTVTLRHPRFFGLLWPQARVCVDSFSVSFSCLLVLVSRFVPWRLTHAVRRGIGDSGRGDSKQGGVCASTVPHQQTAGDSEHITDLASLER